LIARLENLPRDARDTLFLVLVIGICVAPLAAQIPPWTSAATAVLLLWRAALSGWGGRCRGAGSPSPC